MDRKEKIKRVVKEIIRFGKERILYYAWIDNTEWCVKGDRIIINSGPKPEAIYDICPITTAFEDLVKPRGLEEIEVNHFSGHHLGVSFTDRKNAIHFYYSYQCHPRDNVAQVGGTGAYLKCYKKTYYAINEFMNQVSSIRAKKLAQVLVESCKDEVAV